MKWKIISFLAIIILSVAAIRVPLLNISLERDEGEYAYIAWRLGHQELPYRDWIDQKPPAIFWVYKLALMLPLEPIAAIHLMGLLWTAASACALFLLALNFMKLFWALGTAVLFTLLSSSPVIEGTAANTELFMLLPLILSQIIFLKTTGHRDRILLIIIAGALTGVAAAFKQVAAINWFFLVALYPMLAGEEKRVRQTLSFALWSAAGVAGVWGFIAAYFYVHHGFADFIYNVFTHNLEYVHHLSWPARVGYCRRTLGTLWPTQGAAWIFSLAGFAAMLITKKLKSLLFLSGWMITSLIGAGAGGYFFPHYFQQALPVLSLAAALGAEALASARFWEKLPEWLRRAVLGGLIGLPSVVAIYPFIFSYSPGEAVNKIYPNNNFAEMYSVGKRITQITQPDDRVFVFGAEPEVLFYSRRVSATRYIFLFPLYGPYKDALEKQAATAKEITANAPAAALYLPNGLFFERGAEQYFTRWSESYLNDNFQADTCLTVDSANRFKVIFGESNQPPSIPQEQQLVGVVFVKAKNARAAIGYSHNGPASRNNEGKINR